MRGKLVVGNWKMNGGLEANAALLGALLAGWKRRRRTGDGVCVPFPYLGQARDVLAERRSPGARRTSARTLPVRYTGEVSAGMLAEFGCRFVLVGHSERRQLHGETDAMVAAKAEAALAGGLTPVVCVGETLAERDAGQTEAVVGRQFDAVAAVLGGQMALAVVAYEPVWAIGTGARRRRSRRRRCMRSCGDAGRRRVQRTCRVLYGGSVKAANAAALFAMPDIDGGLVGGASLNAMEFLAIAGA